VVNVISPTLEALDIFSRTFNFIFLKFFHTILLHDLIAVIHIFTGAFYFDLSRFKNVEVVQTKAWKD